MPIKLLSTKSSPKKPNIFTLSESDTTHRGEQYQEGCQAQASEELIIEKHAIGEPLQTDAQMLPAELGQQYGVKLFRSIKLPSTFIRNHCHSSCPWPSLQLWAHGTERVWGGMEMGRPWGSVALKGQSGWAAVEGPTLDLVSSLT